MELRCAYGVISEITTRRLTSDATRRNRSYVIGKQEDASASSKINPN